MLGPKPDLFLLSSTPQHETSRGQLVNLLRVAGEPSVDLAVRQVASITFKQAAKRHWEPEKEGECGATQLASTHGAQQQGCSCGAARLQALCSRHGLCMSAQLHPFLLNHPAERAHALAQTCVWCRSTLFDSSRGQAADQGCTDRCHHQVRLKPCTAASMRHTCSTSRAGFVGSCL